MKYKLSLGLSTLRQIIFRRFPLPYTQKGKGNYDALFKKIGIRPNHIEYYDLAFLHRSCCETDALGQRMSNERLEFLGDAILSSIVSIHLYEHYPQWDEGLLSKRKSSVVSRIVNNKVARDLSLSDYLQCRPEVDPSKGDLPGNTLEAFIGALYLDQGFDRVHRFVCECFFPVYQAMERDEDKSLFNYKSIFLEWAQKHHFEVEYVSRNKVMPRKGGLFIYSVEVNGKAIGIGRGTSIKKAHQDASYDAISRLKEVHIEVIPQEASLSTEGNNDEETAQAIESLVV